MSVWAAVVTVAGSVLTMLGVLFTSRATVRAAAATARANEAAAQAAVAPQERAADLAVLKETVARVDGENRELRVRQGRLESIVRAFAWSADRWCRQMVSAGIEPEPPHPLVEEYNRTGV